MFGFGFCYLAKEISLKKRKMLLLFLAPKTWIMCINTKQQCANVTLLFLLLLAIDIDHSCSTDV